jgi:hypothetical protein
MGHKVYLADDMLVPRNSRGQFIKPDKLKCTKCKKKATKDGHDPCIANLPGVTDACCGHGRHEGYLIFENGTVIRGFFDVESMSDTR